MVIKVENLAAKQLINFYLPQKITADNSFIIVTPEHLPDNPLCRAIMQITGINRCLLAENLLAVKYNNTKDYEDIKLLVLAEIDDYITDNGPVISAINSFPILKAVEFLADSLIRPTLNRDGGDLNFISFDRGVLIVQFTGHCAGCPYAQNTLNNIVAKTLRRYIPEINKVEVQQ